MTLLDLIDQYTTAKERNWFALFTCLYGLLWLLLKLFVKEAKGKELSIAHPVVSFVATIQLVKLGFTALLVDGAMMELSTDAYSRLKVGEYEGFLELVQIAFAYELFNTLSSIILPQYRTVEFLGHHILTMMIAKVSQTEGPAFHGLFFVGIASLSTLLLTIVDTFRHGPPFLRNTFPTVNKLARILFALAFFAVRSLAWPLVTIVFWHDGIVTLMAPRAESPWRPYLIMLFFSNTFLGALQVLWTGRIWKGLMKTIQQTSSSSSSDDINNERKDK